jgi:hypothetical protein
MVAGTSAGVALVGDAAADGGLAEGAGAVLAKGEGEALLAGGALEAADAGGLGLAELGLTAGSALGGADAAALRGGGPRGAGAGGAGAGAGEPISAAMAPPVPPSTMPTAVVQRIALKRRALAGSARLVDPAYDP